MDTSCARTNTLLLCRGMCKRLLPILIGLARLKTLDGPKHDFSLECVSITRSIWYWYKYLLDFWADPARACAMIVTHCCYISNVAL